MMQLMPSPSHLTKLKNPKKTLTNLNFQLSLSRLDWITESLTSGPPLTKLSLELVLLFANFSESTFTNTTSWKFTLLNLLLVHLKVVLTYLNFLTLKSKLAWPNHHNSISKCVLWLISRESLKLGQSSEPKRVLPIDT